MIKLKDLFSLILIESGQFLIPQEEIEMDTDKFRVLVSTSLAIYSKYSPVSKSFNINIDSRSFTFTDETLSSNGEKIAIPSRVTDVIPVRIAGVSPYYLREFEENKSPDLSDKVQFPWTYRDNILYVPFSGLFDVSSISKHVVEKVDEEYVINTVDTSDKAFVNLLVGKFLKGVGMSRRAFTLNELPILSDAADLVSEGKDMEKEAIEDMIENELKWYEAW